MVLYRASKRMNGEDVIGHKIRVVCSPQQREYIAFENYPANNFPEENYGEDFCNMHLNKSSQGGYNSTSWKPTWKRSSDQYRQGSSRFHHTTEMSRYNIQSTTAASNSSTPNDTSRDGSPNIVMVRKLYYYGKCIGNWGLNDYGHCLLNQV